MICKGNLVDTKGLLMRRTSIGPFKRETPMESVLSAPYHGPILVQTPDHDFYSFFYYEYFGLAF